ncbi:MAG: hypothetical protein HC899_35365 [Leptolyngbyaceae cyanobacterium SM1_4_3]|nr:hypothetical protein [Leptolyngbyaceae cyanobacterium SM1_4_3]
MSISNRDNTLRSARNLGRLSGSKPINGRVGQSDKIDFAKFTLSEVSEFGLSIGRVVGRASATVTIRNVRGAVVQSFRTGTRPQSFKGKLAEGTYYIGVQRVRGEVSYRLTASARRTEPGEVLSTARKIGVLSGTYVNRDFVGTTDQQDFYKFSLNDIANLQASVTGSSANTRLQLIRDSNNNGRVDNGEVLATGTNFSSTFLSKVTQDLPRGTYYIGVTPSNSSASTRYQLSLVATPFGGNISPEPGNTLSTARNLGVLSGTFSAREHVGEIDSSDIYRFTLDDIANLQATVTATSANTEIQLIRDINNNGLVDNGEILAADTNFSSTFISNFTQDLPTGNYFFKVESRNESVPTLYEMNLVVTPFGGNELPDPGNTLSTARNIGALSGTFSTREHIGILDPNDSYRFTLNNDANLQARVNGSSANTFIELIRDINNNGLVDNGELIASDTNFSSNFLSEITRDLQEGAYFFRVSPRNSSAPTNYSLSLTVG